MWHLEGSRKKSAMAKAEELFNKAQKEKHTLSDIEKAKQTDREKMARLKALRLAKKPT